MNWKEIGEGLGLAAIMEGATEAAKSFLKTAKDKGIEKLQKDFSEYRSELTVFIDNEVMDFDPEAHDGLMIAHRRRSNRERVPYDRTRRYEYGDENKMVTMLTTLYKHLSDEDEYDKRLKTFQLLGHMAKDDPREFDQTLDMLEDDKVSQLTRKVFSTFGQYAPKVAAAVNNGLNYGASAANDAAEAIRTGRSSANPDNGIINAGNGIWNLIKAIWSEGNSTVRGAMAAFLVYLFVWLAVIFTFGAVNAKAGVAILGIVGVMITPIFLAIAQPIVASVIFTGKTGPRKSLRNACFIIFAAQLLIGLYLYIVPVHADPLLFFVVVSCVFIAILLHEAIANHKSRTYRWIITAITLIAIGSSVSLFFGGPKEAPGKLSQYFGDAKSAVADVIQPQAKNQTTEKANAIRFTTDPSEVGTLICSVTEGERYIVTSSEDFRLWLGGNNYSEVYKAGIKNAIRATGTGEWYFKTNKVATGTVEPAAK